jgi:hypothetical protein
MRVWYGRLAGRICAAAAAGHARENGAARTASAVSAAHLETNSAWSIRCRRWTLARDRAVLAWQVALLCGVCGVSAAQEIAPFRLTGVEGYNTVRYMRDEFVTEQPGSGLTPGARSRQAQSDWREELFVMTHSYAYHPNLLSLDIGGGPILQRGSFVSDSGETQSSGALYNFTGRAMFLRDKPYQGAVFYEHLNPTLNVAPGQVITQENTRYGADFSLLAPVTPVPLYMEATRSHFQARGIDRIIDDQIDRFNLRASRSFGALGSTQLQYQTTQQASMSGSPNLAIQSSNSSNQGLSVDSRFQFGAARQYDLTNLITFNTQAYTLQGQNPIPERRDDRMFFDLRGRHSKELQSFGFYNYSSSNQGELRSIVHSAAAGLNYTPRPEFTAGFGMHGDDNQATQMTTTTRGVDGSLRYQRALPLGVAQLSYGLRYDQREQRATAAQTSVIGEPITLVGTSLVALARQHVSAGSVAVNNLTRTQTFVEGSDYALTLVGAETRLQRLIGGAILDGQTLLVDYSYDVGGSFSYSQADQTLNLNWGLLNYVNTYFRYLDSEPRLSSGTPAYPLNTVHSSLVGARVDVPLRLRLEMTLGGSVERENRRETISPHRREAEELHAQTEDPFFGAGNIRISMRRTRVDYENAAQNVRLQGYDLRYWARFWLGVDLSATASSENDTGGVTPRRRLATAVKAQWHYRKLSLSFDLARTLETQGDFRRSRALVQFLARRDF